MAGPQEFIEAPEKVSWPLGEIVLELHVQKDHMQKSNRVLSV